MLVNKSNVVSCESALNIVLYNSYLPDYFVSSTPTKSYPVASPCRGYYFNGTTSLLNTSSSFLIPTNFLLYMWIYPISGVLISKGSGFSVSVTSYFFMLLSNWSWAQVNTTQNLGFIVNKWQYVSLVSSYYNFTQTTQVNISGIVNTYSNNNFYYFFRDNFTSLIIGSDGVSYYKGYIWLIGISSTVLNPLYTSFYMSDISFYCGTSLNPCDYYNPVNITNCTLISESLTNYDYCYDFSNQSCYKCSYGYWDSGSTCSTYTCGQAISYNGVCYPDRGKCLFSLKGLGCSSCNTSYVQFLNLCIPVCPTGYSYNSNNCTHVNSTIVVLKLSNILITSNYSGFNFGTDHTNSYPTIDINDPIPAFNRGYYFTSNTSLTSSQYFLGPNLFICIWIRLNQFGDIFSKQINSVDTLKIYHNNSLFYYINTTFQQYTNQATNLVDMYNWQFVGIGAQYDPLNILTTLYISYSKNNDLWTITNDFYSDYNSSLFVIGSNKNSGFFGFLYSIEIYNYQIWIFYNANCNGYYVCPDLSSLGVCNISQVNSKADSYYCGNSSYCNGCVDCLSNCSYGCVRPSDCSLCSNPVCTTCQNFTEYCGLPVGSNAGTNHNYVNCDSTCLTCTGPSYNQCSSCKPSLVYFSYYFQCLPISICSTLPGVPAYNATQCKTSNGLVFSTKFTSFQTPFYDTISNISISTQPNSTFYPNYGKNDPVIAAGRGYYFNQTSYLLIDSQTTSKLVIGPEFDLGFWINAQSEGLFFIRKTLSGSILNFTIFSNNTANIGINSKIFTYSLPYSIFNSWHLFEIRLGLASAGNIFLLSIDSHPLSINHINYFQDSYQNVITSIGSDVGINGFTGFIWSIEIYNIWTSLNTSNDILNNCYYPSNLTACLSNCSINQFLPDCNNCSSVCAYGCVSANSCSLCDDPLCYNCSIDQICITCVSEASLYNNECRFSNCYQNCAFCTGPSALSCLECMSGFYNVSGYCILCPTGYFVNNHGQCVLNTSIVFFSAFTGLSGLFYDTITSVPILTGTSTNFYPNYDVDDPVAAYLRGFYFNGHSSVLRLPQYQNYTSPSIVFSINWTIEVWILPNYNFGCIFYYTSLNGTLLSICISQNIEVTISMTESTLQTVYSSSDLALNKWQVLRISLQSNLQNQLNLYVNNQLDSQHSINGTIFPNYFLNPSTSIGTNFSSYYKGFIYQLSIFNLAIPPSRFLQSTSCSVSLNGFCLPECLINEYWSGYDNNDYTNCSSCNNECSLGCRRKDSCSLCYDPLCSSCEDYNNLSCTTCSKNSKNTEKCECSSGSVLDHLSYSCIYCSSNQYYNNITCKNCSGLCKTCNSDTCFNCVENAYLINKTCLCPQGFNGTNSCTLAYFSASLLVNKDNSLLVTFEDTLYKDLKLSDISIQLSWSLNFTFSLSKWSNIRYYIVLKTSEEIPSNSQIALKFTTKILSVYNSFLNSTTLYGVLYSTISSDTNSTISAEQTSSTAVTASTAAAVGFSMMNPNPACLWSFINTIQMLCFIGLSSINLPPKFKGYLKGLKKYNMFPNIFEYFVPRNGGQKPFQKAYEFGYTDNLILFNSGNYISAFISMLCLWLLTFVFSKLTRFKPFSISFIKNKINSSLQNYKYGAFIRFWITCYIDIFAASVIAIQTTTIFVWESVLNYSVALIFIVRYN